MQWAALVERVVRSRPVQFSECSRNDEIRELEVEPGPAGEPAPDADAGPSEELLTGMDPADVQSLEATGETTRQAILGPP